jgi:hypothetical protein
MDYHKIVNECYAACQEVDLNDDGGSCNLDIVLVKDPNFAYAAKSKFGVYYHEKNWQTIMPPRPAQGFARTAQCDAIVGVLKNYGIQSFVEYHMD